ncbi:TetR/AcrR family transcriptional regulator C-terminal domain-containing protein [Frankia sp. CNm7]|uniref:TetR/AcrR family transcriptional regulator C-terminal domain-containing protein n=1 Tax=Frankia nepalensis TaxID=1836974 RepID=A0A937RL72_9ACTN|nr:TetR family transcriptional regulator [Frankia nepalensis]MBL7498517.1 TetR/AcrR family transcriptional regulator C-terminal domain-containing protein [Frankia nepalensis]MBL7513980.1 TetR/AcrR family transcriptional regulator C-terminal domain-containing protein [Frankia nepalensis]MBL7523230.1 TetR/AcrR family transcriptional regulator C-terminal domain-containing protein [Frankia nepalensis]MBL7630874.1 TetR/AcrR family transcriptional regulator C-terminal domain-containing protein [Frank
MVERRVGRPPRIDRATIARAAGEIGIDQVSLRSVAERLGVSVPGLYHYVRGRDDLLRLAAEQSAARIELPTDRGQHWAAWLLEWADVIRRALVESPALLAQFMNGGFGLDRMVETLEVVIAVLVRHGFDRREAYEAYLVVTHCAMGAAVTEIRRRETDEPNNPIALEYQRVLAQRDARELPHLRAMLAAGPPPDPAPADQLTTVLAGIAARRGDDWREVVDRLRDHPAG